VSFRDLWCPEQERQSTSNAQNTAGVIIKQAFVIVMMVLVPVMEWVVSVLEEIVDINI
jgi:dihydrodipicolinate reductase